MADNNMNSNDSTKNQTMQHEQAKASVSGNDRKPEQGQGGFDQNRQSEQGKMGEKSAIGGGDNKSQTGEPGRGRSELGQSNEFDKSKTETSNQR